MCVYPPDMRPPWSCERQDLPRPLVEAVATFVTTGLNELAPADAVAVNRALAAGGQLIVLVDPVAVVLQLVLTRVSGESTVLGEFGRLGALMCYRIVTLFCSRRFSVEGPPWCFVRPSVDAC